MDKKITQKELAKKLCISATFMQQLLTDEFRRPSPAMAKRLEIRTGIKKELWIWGGKYKIRKALEDKYGKINYGRGRLRAKK